MGTIEAMKTFQESKVNHVSRDRLVDAWNQRRAIRESFEKSFQGEKNAYPKQFV